MIGFPIREPRWCMPAVTVPGGTLTAAVEAHPELGTRLELRAADDVIPLDTVPAPTGKPGIALLVATLPANCPPGVWDLVFHDGAVSACMPGCVAVRDPFAERITIACTGDWHILPRESAGIGIDTSARYDSLVKHLNHLAPDCVVHVGDVITRYDLDKNARPDHEIRAQVAIAHGILTHLEPPLFVAPGNHDVAFDNCRTAWGEHFGRPWRSDTDDAVVRFGPCQIVLVDGFAHYDEETLESTAHCPTDAQLDWLGAQCARPTEAQWRLLALHYDYAQRILPQLRELRIDAVTYGHAGPMEQAWFEAAGARDAVVPTNAAYRLITVTPDDMQVGVPVSYEEVEGV